LLEVQESKDAEGLRVFYYLVQDLKCLEFTLISLHFKVCTCDFCLHIRGTGVLMLCVVVQIKPI
jgi:hypothetical protein